MPLGAPFSGLGSLLGGFGAFGHSSGGVAPTIYSTEFGRTTWGNDYAFRSSAPANGVLFSTWIKIPDTITTYPFTRGNIEVFVLNYDNWIARCIAGNINATSPTACTYNVNSMILCDGTSVGEANNSYAGDYTYSVDSGLTVDTVSGWVFVAWQFYNDGANLVMRQWVKYAGQTLLGPYTSTVAYATLRNDVVSNAGWNPVNAAAWTPGSTPVSFTLGSLFDQCNGYYIHARMEQLSTLPSNSYIESIAALTAADPTAWGDWSLEYGDLGCDLTDRSGNGRDLTLRPGGTLYQGPVF